METLDIDAPIERCFDLARSVDLHLDTSRPIGARAESGRSSGLSGPGDQTTWSARYFGVRFRITTRIEAYDPPRAYREVMVSGLPRRFEHLYSFEPLSPDRTRMTDEFTFEGPLGPLGLLAERLLALKLASALSHRCRMIKRVAESEE